MQLRLRQLDPWTLAAPPVPQFGGRVSSRRNVFEAGGYRLTWVAEPNDPSVLGRVEFVFREKNLDAVARRLIEMVDRLGFNFHGEMEKAVSDARPIPDDLARLATVERMVTVLLSQADWRGVVSILAEPPLDGHSMLRAMWMVELRVFRPDFRAASDP